MTLGDVMAKNPSQKSAVKTGLNIKTGVAKNSNTLYCSFCGKSQHDVFKLIAGPSVFICSECIEICSDIVVVEKGPTEPITHGPMLRYAINVNFDRSFDARETNLIPALIHSIQNAYPGSTISLKSFEVKKDGWGAIDLF